MADNVAITPGTGATIATDDVGGVQYQRVKLDVGGDGAASPLVRGQQAKASSLPVALASDQDALPVTDNGGSLTVDDGGTSLTVDGTVAITGSVNVDGSGVTQPISAAALPLPSGAATAAKQPALGAAGSASADVITVQGVASMTPLLVDGSGATQPVSGTVTANLGATDNAVLDAIAASLATIDNVVAGNEAQVDVLSLPALPAGTNNIGDVDILSIAAGDNNIGNVDVVTMPNVTLAAGTNTNEIVGDAAHGAAVAGNPVLAGLEGRSSDGTAVDSGDVVRPLATLTGKLVTAPFAIPENLVQGITAAITGTSSTEVIAAGAAGIRNYLTALTVTNSHATVGTVVEIRDGASTVMFRGYAAPAGGGFSVQFPTPLKGSAATAVNAFAITTGSNTYVSASGFRGI